MSWLERIKGNGTISATAAANATNWQIDAAAVTLCALLSAGAYFAAIGPMLGSRQDGAAREASLIETRDQAARMVAATRLLRSQLNAAQTTLASIEIPLHPSQAMNQRLAELTALASECGLEVQAMQPGALGTSSRYAQVPIQVSGTGSYRTCLKFFRNLRQRFPDTAMRGFELSASPSEPNTPTSFSFQLIWYVQPTSSDAVKR